MSAIRFPSRANQPPRSVISERVRSIPPSGIRKFFDLLAGIDGVISLGVGEPDFVTPWHIRESAIYSLERGYTMYTSNYGLLELRQELARHLEHLYGVEYDPAKQLLITTGVSEGLDIALRAILDPGDEVIIPDPTYVSYSPCTVLAGGVVVPVPTAIDHDFQVSAAEIEKRVTPRTKAILIGYPNNPTGAVMPRQGLMAVADLARRHDLIVISDEIYDRLVYECEHVCFASLPGMWDRTILLGGFSKAYAMTGWRIGYAAAPAEILEAMMKVHQYVMMCAPTPAQKAAIEALRTGEPAVHNMVAEYNRRRRVIYKGFVDMGLRCFEPRGAFYVFPNIEITGLNSEQFAERLLKEEKVAVVPGDAFGDCGKGHVRCCYATSLKNINEAMARIARFVERCATREVMKA
ncbi:MAG: aminotransferase class I/II-fold pyridoxal phosphate-dependent enzyme [Chloroflexi bacterium]|nr:aminotransferase class I/II-fold pyridoxal phosphate-dependent enzyme [Chloroflexota bacterium]